MNEEKVIDILKRILDVYKKKSTVCFMKDILECAEYTCHKTRQLVNTFETFYSIIIGYLFTKQTQDI